MSFDTIVIGHLPPPVTGENLCRAELVSILRKNGSILHNISRKEGLKAFRRGHHLIIFNGGSNGSIIFDMILTLVGVFLYRNVYWCFHNSSWISFLRIPSWFWLGRQFKIRAIVLRPEICRSFLSRDYNAYVLNNCPAALFELNTFNAPLAKKRMIWLGRLEVAKGFDVALECYRLLSERDSEWRFDVFGGDARDAEQLGLYHPSATYHGFISGCEKVSALDAGGIFLLPSRYIHETQPLSIIEAMSRGIPVVASRAGGILGMVNSSIGDAGFALPGYAPEEYANAVEAVLNDYLRYSETARLAYIELFSRKRYSASVEEFFLDDDRHIKKSVCKKV